MPALLGLALLMTFCNKQSSLFWCVLLCFATVVLGLGDLSGGAMSTTTPSFQNETPSSGGGEGDGQGGSLIKCIATFSVPLASTDTTSTNNLPNLPEYSPLSEANIFTFYKISSVDLSRAGDLTINVALTNGRLNETFNAYETGLTPLRAQSLARSQQQLRVGSRGIGAAQNRFKIRTRKFDIFGDSKSSNSSSSTLHKSTDGGEEEGTNQLSDDVSAMYDTVYDRYVSFGQFADAETQAQTNMAQLRSAIFNKEGGSEVEGGGKFLVSAKSRLLGSLMVPADYIDVSSDYDSQEGHGIADVIFKKYGRIDVLVTPSLMSITLRRFSSYRIANDEFVYFNFFNNLTSPAGCLASRPLVIHITGFQSSLPSEIASFTSFVVLVVGLVIVFFGSNVPTSHHAGLVGMLATTRFAHEDGQPLPFILSPFQASIGSDKYQYVLGAVVSDVSLVLIIALLQLIAVRVLRMRSIPSREAAGQARWPFISVAFFTHLSPQIFFLLGRLLGRINLTSIITAAVIILLMAGTVVAIAKKVISANESFGAFLDMSRTDSRRYRKALKEGDAGPRPTGGFGERLGGLGNGSPPFDGDDNDDEGSAEEGVPRLLREDPLLLELPVFGGMFKSRGEWVARQPVNFFLERWGYLFMAYRKKHWLIIEYADAMICGLVSVLDNYTSTLAMYQYGIFSFSKLAVLVLIITIRPALRPLDTNMLVLSYAGQLMASIALFVGSIKAQLLESFTTAKDVALVFTALVLAVHILLVLFESVRGFYRRIAYTDERRRMYELARERHEYVTDMILKASSAEGQGQAGGNMRSPSPSNNGGRSLSPSSSLSVLVDGEPKIERDPFGVRHADSTLLKSLVEGHLPGSIGARQVEARNLKFDPKNILPAQEAFRIHNDGSITVVPSAIGSSQDWLYNSVTDESSPPKPVEGDIEPQPTLRQVNTPHGPVLVEPVFATWGLYESGSDESDDSSIDGTRSKNRANSGGKRGKGGGGGTTLSNTGSRRSKFAAQSGSRFGGKSILASSVDERSGRGGRGRGQRGKEESSSSEDSDSNYDSEGLPVTSIEQRIRKRARRAERAKRRADRMMRRQMVVDADGDYLFGDDDEVDDDEFFGTWSRPDDGNLNGTKDELDLLLRGGRVDGAMTGAKPSAASSRGGENNIFSSSSTNVALQLGTFPSTRSALSSAHNNRSKYAGSSAASHASFISSNSGADFLALSAAAHTTELARGGALPLTDEQLRQQERQVRRRERREQKQLSKGIVTSTANLVKSLPMGGVNIRQFNAFVDSIPSLSLEDRARHKRRLADKIRSIYRDRAREAANKRMQEKVKRAMLRSAPAARGGGLDEVPAPRLAAVATIGGIPEARATAAISAALKKGGVRSMHYITEIAEKKSAAAELEAQRLRQQQQRLLFQQQQERKANMISSASFGPHIGFGLMSLSSDNLASRREFSSQGGGGGAGEFADLDDGVVSSVGVGSLVVGTGADMAGGGGGGALNSLRNRRQMLVVGHLGSSDESLNSDNSEDRLSPSRSSSDMSGNSSSSQAGDTFNEDQQHSPKRTKKKKTMAIVDEDGNVFEFDSDLLGGDEGRSVYSGDEAADGTASVVSERTARSARSRASRLSGSSKKSRRSSHNTLTFGDKRGGGGASSHARSESGASAAFYTSIQRRKRTNSLSKADAALEEEIAQQRRLNKELNLRHGGANDRRGGGGDASSRGRGGGGGRGIDHDWLILDDDVQAKAAQYSVRLIDTIEAAEAHAIRSQQTGHSEHQQAQHAVVTMVDAGAEAGTPPLTAVSLIKAARERDAAKQRLARQAGTLVAVWESIGDNLGKMEKEAQNTKMKIAAENSAFAVAFPAAAAASQSKRPKKSGPITAL